MCCVFLPCIFCACAYLMYSAHRESVHLGMYLLCWFVHQSTSLRLYTLSSMYLALFVCIRPSSFHIIVSSACSSCTSCTMCVSMDALDCTAQKTAYCSPMLIFINTLRHGLRCKDMQSKPVQRVVHGSSGILWNCVFHPQTSASPRQIRGSLTLTEFA
jgi:hypothetical protein